MSLASITPVHAHAAMVIFFDEFTEWLTGIYGEAPVARLLKLDLAELAQEQQEDDAEAGLSPLQGFFKARANSNSADESLYREGVAAIAPVYGRFAWDGEVGALDLRGWHSKVFFLREVVAATRSNVFSVVGEWNPNDVIGERRVDGHRAIDVLHMGLSAFLARMAVDDGVGLITIEDLAALARVSDKTVRMAANPKNEGALRTYKDGKRTYIKPEDAREWLARRPDFKPTKGLDQGASVAGRMTGGVTNLREFLLHASRRVGGMDALGEKLREAGLLADQSTSPGIDVGEIDVGALLRLADYLGLDSPAAFARWVVDIAHGARLERAAEEHRRHVAMLAPRSVAANTARTGKAGEAP